MCKPPSSLRLWTSVCLYPCLRVGFRFLFSFRLAYKPVCCLAVPGCEDINNARLPRVPQYQFGARAAAGGSREVSRLSLTRFGRHLIKKNRGFRPGRPPRKGETKKEREKQRRNYENKKIICYGGLVCASSPTASSFAGWQQRGDEGEG